MTTLASGDVRSLFESTGALLTGHFLLSSGLHSPHYMQCALLISQPRLAERLGRSLARLAPSRPDVVLSPALGGVVIGQEVARALDVRHLFLERAADGSMALRRGFALKPGERFVVVEDVVTTGKSSAEVIAAAGAQDARPIAVLSIVDRTAGAAALAVPLRSLMAMEIPTYSAAECPLCRQGLALVKPGSRPESPQRDAHV